VGAGVLRYRGEGDSLEPIGVKIHFHNARLRSARGALGMRQGDVAEASGIPQKRYSAIETFRVAPTDQEIAALAAVLQKPTDWLFPPEIMDFDQSPYRVVPLDAVLDLPADDPLHLPMKEGLFEYLEARLAPRELEVLKMRFCEGMTLEQVGDVYGVTRERIRQIEARAIGYLRHPKITAELKRWKNF